MTSGPRGAKHAHMQACDVAVVGAGAAGLGCAVALVRAGLRVAILDRPPPQASLVAGGMLGPVSEAAHQTDPRSAEMILQLGLEGLAAWRRHGAALGVAVRPVGAVLAQGRDVQARALQLAQRSGWPVEQRGQALFLPGEAVLNPAQALAAMGVSLRRAGVRFVETDTIAQPWTTPAGRVCGVRLGDTAIAAEAVVLAPGAQVEQAWARLAPQLQALTPARGCILGFSGLPEALDAPVWRGEGLYLVAQPGGLLLAGASMEIGQREAQVDAAVAAGLRAAALALRPELASAPWRAQAGVRALAPLGRPLLSPAAPGLFLAAGMGRNGWLFSLAAGERLAAMITGGGPLRFARMERDFPA